MASELLNALVREKIVAIARGLTMDEVKASARALSEGGIAFLEVTLNTEGALGMIAKLREEYGDRMRIGAGTVLDIGQAKEAIAAGAEYLISPNVDVEVIYHGAEQGLDVWPGAMTPTEIVQAYKAGASAIKLFPMGTLGIGYLKEVRAPLDDIPFIATGGVNLQNIRDVLDAGAVAVGMGGKLLDPALVKAGKYDQLRELARAFANKAHGASAV
ncbi:bifunctional 4-hydroxy-2-oxoglutarate aldolase/2-dehydro-3-deoxy-phosphogluconate aldolase [Paenibacillaceae bacterium WGS1546]|uniref:bifunctional 4-hydroxy-2-oxoglutarate aldolase/2-dehydro-3-deoxy-phosphogluconate aldolase n=1 Tax=Cohnella sp. WGS1546 TaxID=3366810 RepID=UPI00372D6A07